jgi:hypothetical protein
VALRRVQPHVDNTPGVLMHEEASQLNPRISVRQHGPFRVGATLQLVPRPVVSGVLASRLSAWRCLLRLPADAYKTDAAKASTALL